MHQANGHSLMSNLPLPQSLGGRLLDKPHFQSAENTSTTPNITLRFWRFFRHGLHELQASNNWPWVCCSTQPPTLVEESQVQHLLLVPNLLVSEAGNHLSIGTWAGRQRSNHMVTERYWLEANWHPLPLRTLTVHKVRLLEASEASFDCCSPCLCMFECAVLPLQHKGNFDSPRRCKLPHRQPLSTLNTTS